MADRLEKAGNAGFKIPISIRFTLCAGGFDIGSFDDLVNRRIC